MTHNNQHKKARDMSLTEANSVFMSGGKSAKFEDVGDKIVGVILDAEVTQQTDMDDNNSPKFWPDGKPMMQVVITLQTDDREDDDDDGTRVIYAKSNMFKAIQEVVRPHKGLAVGGKLAVQYTGDGERKKKGWNPPKLYKAQYEPPTKSVDMDGENGLF